MIELPQFGITIGPIEEAIHNSKKYNQFINVSDSIGPQFCQPNAYWYPINELSNWGYGPFFWFIKTLNQIYKHNKTFIHCHAGVCRSPSMVIGWLFYHGYVGGQIETMVGKEYLDRFIRFQDDGVIPKDILWFFTHMKEHPDYSLMGLLAKMDGDNIGYKRFLH